MFSWFKNTDQDQSDISLLDLEEEKKSEKKCTPQAASLPLSHDIIQNALAQHLDLSDLAHLSQADKRTNEIVKDARIDFEIESDDEDASSEKKQLLKYNELREQLTEVSEHKNKIKEIESSHIHNILSDKEAHVPFIVCTTLVGLSLAIPVWFFSQLAGVNEDEAKNNGYYSALPLAGIGFAFGLFRTCKFYYQAHSAEQLKESIKSNPATPFLNQP